MSYPETVVLRDESEYDSAVREINALLDADPPKGSEQCDRLEFLSVLVEAYECEHHPIEDSQDLVTGDLVSTPDKCANGHSLFKVKLWQRDECYLLPCSKCFPNELNAAHHLLLRAYVRIAALEKALKLSVDEPGFVRNMDYYDIILRDKLVL